MNSLTFFLGANQIKGDSFSEFISFEICNKLEKKRLLNPDLAHKT